MVILTNLYGQTSNNFFQHIHLDSFCRENKIKFFNPMLGRMHKDYPKLRKQGYLMCSYSLIRILKLAGYSRYIKKVHFDDHDHNYEPTMFNNKIIFCDGWYFRSFSTTIKYRPFYQKLFNPNLNKKYLHNKYLERASPEEVIIGVHIRRGDYKYYANGIYYYSDDLYIAKIRQLINILNTDKYKILLFSDDRTLTIEEFKKDFKEVVITNGTELVDHYLMSKCDYIIGPPSTFSLWASYIGETPFYHFKNADDKISLDKFSVCNG